ncbi:MAG TPA: hypothetical protein VLF69_05145, partial [Candidatus Saccharimonadales bacterium]|nr:hypothetical protein [Candidatus Saccharimonadales bacterium]
MTAELSPDDAIAAHFVGNLWTAIRVAGGPYPDTDDHHVFRELFDPTWLEQLALPIGDDRPAAQTVALGEAMRFDRPNTDEGLATAYATRPRTRIYEGIDARSGGWPAA